jgi:hypothetical protein
MRTIFKAVFVLAGLALVPVCAARPPSALEGLKAFVVERIAADIPAFSDCSQLPIDVLDAHAGEPETQWLAHWAFTWSRAAVDGRLCLYLEKPERRGLTAEEARLLMLATSGSLVFPDASIIEWVCPKRGIRDGYFEWINVKGAGTGYTYGITYADAREDLEPLDRLQRQFAASILKQVGSASTRSTGDRSVGISFQLMRTETLASIKADVAVQDGSTTPVRSEQRAWLVQMPEGRIVSFDELFVDPVAFATHMSPKVRANLKERYGDRINARFERDRQAEKDIIGRRVDQLTDPARRARWEVMLDYYDACEPGLIVQFDSEGLTPAEMERPQARFSAGGIRNWLKPEYRDAFGEPTAKRQAFPPGVVAGLFPALLDVASHDRLPIEELQPDLVDCANLDLSSVQPDSRVERSKWMYNGVYRWSFLARPDGTCIVLSYPERRGLSRDEAWSLLSVARKAIPVDASRIDPAFWSEYPLGAARDFGGSASYSHGTSNGVGYEINYMGISDSLGVLDEVQRRFARETLAAARAERVRRAGATALSLRLDFSAAGRTAELAVLAAHGELADASGVLASIQKSWMLHVPSGKLLAFEDLFVDPARVRMKISEDYRREIPNWRSFEVFLDDPTGEQAAAHRRRHEQAAWLASEPTPERFRNVHIDTDPDRPLLSVQFQAERLPSGEIAAGGATLKSLRGFLKPEYARVFDTATRSGQ